MTPSRITARAVKAWHVLERVPDPEVPVVSVVDLGIVREVVEEGDGGLAVVLTPTYSGCPATEVIELCAELIVNARVNKRRGTMAGRMAWRAGYSNDDARPVTSTKA